MGTSKKKNLKIAAATGMTIFSLVSVFVATMAWFVLRQKVGATGMLVKAEDETGRLNKIEFYEYIETIDVDTAPKFSFSNTPSATIYGGTSDFEGTFVMSDYNPLHTDHPLLILFTLKSNFVSTTAGDMFIKGHTDTEGFLGATNSSGLPVYNLGSTAPTLRTGTKDIEKEIEVDGVITTQTVTVDCYPLSSAVNFRCAAFSSSEFSAIEDTTNGRINILNSTTALPLRESFVNFASSGAGITFTDSPTIYSYFV